MMRAPLKSRYLLILATLSLALTFIAWGSALTTGLFSEDENHVLLANYTVNGHWPILLESFTQPWMQACRSAAFYRPVIDVSLVIDALIYGKNVWGYHLSNLFYHALTSFNVGLIAYLLSRQWQYKRANEAGLMASALFAVNPLAQEILAWVVCRCDGLSLMFGSLSFVLYLLNYQSKNQKLLSLSLLSFILAMGAKETALIYPFIILLHALISGAGQKISTNLRQSSVAAYFGVFAVFMALRFYFVGGFGSYSSSVGQLLDTSVMERLGNLGNWLALAYPLNASDLNNIMELSWAFALAFVALAIGIASGALQITRGQKSVLTKVSIFSVVGLLMALLPSYQILTMEPGLANTRALYTPACLFLILVGTLLSATKNKSARRLWLVYFASISALAASRNTLAWIDCTAMNESLKANVQKFIQQNPESILSIANAPYNYCGGAPPTDTWQTRVTASGIMGELPALHNVSTSTSYLAVPDLINPQRTLEQSHSQGGRLALVLPPERGLFKLLDTKVTEQYGQPLDLVFKAEQFIASTKPNKMTLHFDAPLASAELRVLETNHLLQRAELAEVTLRRKGTGSTQNSTARIVEPPRRNILPQNGQMIFFWHNDLSSCIARGAGIITIPDLSNDLVIYRFPLSDRASYRCASTNYVIELFNIPQGYDLVQVRLTDGHKCVPTIKPNSAFALHEALTYGATSIHKEPLVFDYDASSVDGASSVQLEILELDAAIHHQKISYFDGELSHSVTLSEHLPETKGQYILDPYKLKGYGHYQLRILALDKSGKPTGYGSMPRDVAFRPALPPDKPTQDDEIKRLIFDNRPPRLSERFKNPLH